MCSVRPAEKLDVDVIVAIHREMFQGFLMTLMGPGFLKGYYRSILDSPVGVLFVVENDDGRVVGFVAGFTSPRDFYAFFRRRRALLALKSFGYVILRPNTWLRIFENISTVNRVADTGSVSPDCSAELSSIAVRSDIEGQGYGKTLVERFIAQCSQVGVTSVGLTTDAEHNDRVNWFYQRIGFEKITTFKRANGRLMNAYRMNILGAK